MERNGSDALRLEASVALLGCFSVAYSTWGNSLCRSIPPGGIGLRLALSSYFAALSGSCGNLQAIFPIIYIFFLHYFAPAVEALPWPF